MADYAHEQTDKIIEKMEKQVAKEYKQAEKELTKKIKDYLKKFEEKDKAKQKQLADGQITQEEYNNWKIGQLATGDRWKAMRDTLAEEITKANDIAKSTINGHMEDVYSLNHNYATYQVEKDAMIDTSYTLYNRRSTEELFKNKKSLLPAPKEGTQAWQAAHNKDLRWNQQKINSSMIQGILQGDSIPQIAKRLREVVGMNSRSAMRNARTMTTSIENKGRDDAYSELREKGIELETVWVATLDDRTRHSHRLLHGEIRDEKTGKYSNGLRYPADPMGEPEEVYNCRCAETSYVKGFPVDIPKWSPKMGDMTYEEWLGEHEEKEAVSVEEKPVVLFTPASTKEEAEEYALQFADSVSFDGISLKNANIINEQMTTLTTKYPINKLMDYGNRKTHGVMSANYKHLNVNGKKLGTAITEGAKRFEETQKQLQQSLETIKSRYPNALPPAIKKQIGKIEDSLKFSRWGVLDSYEDHLKACVTHEYGHILSDQYFGMINKENANYAYRWRQPVKDMNKKWQDVFERSIKTGDIYSLSEYGRSNVYEFFAESFAAREMGEQLPSYVEELMSEVLKNGIMQ